jgi:circadian clock protein KaiB
MPGPSKTKTGTTSELERAGQSPSGYCLRLFVTGATPRSARALRHLQRICERYLAGQYTLEVVDLFDHPEAAAEAQVIAAPTLVKDSPGPVRRLVGDLSDEARVLVGLGLPPAVGA